MMTARGDGDGHTFTGNKAPSPVSNILAASVGGAIADGAFGNDTQAEASALNARIVARRIDRIVMSRNRWKLQRIAIKTISAPTRQGADDFIASLVTAQE